MDLEILIKLSNLLNYNFLSDCYPTHKHIVILETGICKIHQLYKDKSLKIIYIHFKSRNIRYFCRNIRYNILPEIRERQCYFASLKKTIHETG